MMSDLNYCNSRFSYTRRSTLEVKVGDLTIGGKHPVVVQSMTTTNTQDVQATVEQTLQLARSGCQLVRITAPTVRDAQALQDIVKAVRREGVKVPFCADIHFQPKAAVEALKWVEKVRINPGNFVDIKTSQIKEFSEEDWQRGVQRVYDTFGPFVKEAKERGVALRIGTNHGSLSDRMLYRYGDSVHGMVESALEYLRVCEDHNFDQVIFSMKSSNPRVVVQAYRLLAARLAQSHKPYPFHLGVTEAGDGEDGRLKSAVGIGSLLADGLGDTIRVSLTEHPVKEIPVAREIIRCVEKLVGTSGNLSGTVSSIPETVTQPIHYSEALDYYSYERRLSAVLELESVPLGGKNPPLVFSNYPLGTPTEKITGMPKPDGLSIDISDSEFDLSFFEKTIQGGLSATSLGLLEVSQSQQLAKIFLLKTPPSMGLSIAPHLIGEALEQLKNYQGPIHWIHIQLNQIDSNLLQATLPLQKKFFFTLSYVGKENSVHAIRKLAATCATLRLDYPILLSGTLTSQSEGLELAIQWGGLLADGIGDGVLIQHPILAQGANLAFGILQAAGARRTKTEYISCPSCGRTLFDLETTTQKIRALTSHLKEVSIAIMGCIVNGPGEMADADFGYVGGAPGKVNLYVGRDCIQRGINEEDAPQALIELIKDHGRWKEPVH